MEAWERLQGTDALIGALDDGATVITGSRRLARHLRGIHSEAMDGRGRSVWPSPDILPLDAFLRRCADRAGLAPPADDVILHTLWEDAVAREAGSGTGTDLGRLAAAAAQAHTLATEWRLPEEALAAGPETTRIWCRWRDRVQERLKAGGRADPAGLAGELAEKVSGAPADTFPARIILAGLEELTPQQEQLFASLKGDGAQIMSWRPSPPSEGRRVRVGLADPDVELESALRWAVRRLRERPEERVAVVVPDLAARRESIVRLLDGLAQPPRRTAAGASQPPAWNLSLGRPLLQEPLVAAACLGLAAMETGRRPDADLDALGRLLRSSWFLGSEEDLAEAVIAEAALRRLRRRQPGLGDLIRAAPASSGLRGRLEAARDLCTSPGKRTSERTPSEWADAIPRILSALGWPGDGSGERTLSSSEWQARQAFGETLSRLGHLEAVEGRVPLSRARALLERMLSQRLFQPEAPDARLQVLGRLELAGLSFDAVWATRMQDDDWPAAPRPDPFLPRHLQVERGMPHADAGRELAFARRVTEGLAASAPEVIMSWPASEGDRPLRASTLIRDLPEVAAAEIPVLEDPVTAGMLLGRADCETFVDERGPALPPGAALSGGSSAVRDQSLCPFRGFAAVRLGAEAPEEPADGIPPQERGRLVHRLMEAFWNRVRGSDGLASLDDDGVTAVLDELAEPIYAKFARQRRDLAGVVDIERRRVVAICRELVCSERSRGPFQVGSEVSRSLDLAGIRLRLKLDRVDHLPDGRRLVVDYKTGRERASDWFGDRPASPQLPLYMAALGSGVAALGFGLIRSDTPRFTGVAEEEGLLPEVPAFPGRFRKVDAPDYPGQLAHWREALARLGAELADGRADVDPQDGACKYCDLGRLCRVGETGGGSLAEGMAAEDADD